MPIYPLTDTSVGPLIKTQGKTIFIESMTGSGADKRFVYVDFDSNKRWAVVGSCAACGYCEEGSERAKTLTWDDSKKIGERGKALDPDYATRLDFPMLPEPDPNCTDKNPCTFRFEPMGAAV